MKLLEVLTPKQIILVCGNLCSGKGHYCKTKYPDYHAISVSGIVKSLTQSSERSELTKTAYLDKRILECLGDQIQPFDKVIIDGIRQMTIIKGLEQKYGDQIKDIVWLEVPIDTLKTRFENRAAKKDDLPFEKALQADRDLGVSDVETYIKAKHTVVPH